MISILLRSQYLFIENVAIVPVAQCNCVEFLKSIYINVKVQKKLRNKRVLEYKNIRNHKKSKDLLKEKDVKKCKKLLLYRNFSKNVEIFGVCCEGDEDDDVEY